MWFFKLMNGYLLAGNDTGRRIRLWDFVLEIFMRNINYFHHHKCIYIEDEDSVYMRNLMYRLTLSYWIFYSNFLFHVQNKNLCIVPTFFSPDTSFTTVHNTPVSDFSRTQILSANKELKLSENTRKHQTSC